VLLGLLLLLNPVSLRGVQAAQRPSTGSAVSPQAAAKPSLEEQESQALQDAVRSSEDNPQALIKNLEGFLGRFPESAQREQILHVIYKSALRGNDPQTAIECGEKLLGLKPGDTDLLSSLVDMLDRQGDAFSRVKALHYATSFVDRAEMELKGAARSAGGKDRVPDSPTIMLATAYLMRGKLYAKSGEPDKAVADYDRMKYVMHARDTLSHGDINDHRKDVEDILTVAPERRSPEQKALVTALKNYDHFHGNDYEYDYREDEP